MTEFLSDDPQAKNQILRHRKIWAEKPVLRRIYNEEFFSRLLAYKVPGGVSIEIGGGPGFLRELIPEVISTDLIRVPGLQASVDAQRLPFKSGSVSNILGQDVLHHLASPMRFLKETERVLRPGGRLILVEPWVTPFSYVIYRYLHQEDCDLSAQPLDIEKGHLSKMAFEGNQAIPYLLFSKKYVTRTMEMVPSLRVVVLEKFCLFAYLLSFGFKRLNLLPEALYPVVRWLERVSLPLWRWAGALRIFLVIEKAG
jgi:SAM-dependent methyltransferase